MLFIVFLQEFQRLCRDKVIQLKLISVDIFSDSVITFWKVGISMGCNGHEIVFFANKTWKQFLVFSHHSMVPYNLLEKWWKIGKQRFNRWTTVGPGSWGHELRRSHFRPLWRSIALTTAWTKVSNQCYLIQPNFLSRIWNFWRFNHTAWIVMCGQTSSTSYKVTLDLALFPLFTKSWAIIVRSHEWRPKGAS